MSSFGGTVKLTGESEYRKALSEISSNLKVLNSEMKTVTSEYDKNDKSVENLSSQNEVLNKKIDEQEKKVSILKDALEKSKKETGDNSETTKKWQTELNYAQAELNKLNKDVITNEQVMRQEEEAVRKGYKSFDEMAEAEKKAQKETVTLGDLIKANLISDLIKSGISALADGIKAVGSAMGDCLKDGAAYADTLITLSAQTGLSTDTLEKYNAISELADVSMETFTGSLAKTTKAMGEAQKGSTKYVEAYKKLGVSVTDANGNLRDSEDVYWETVDALKGIENETERDALAMELFGKSAQDLNTIIDMGSEGFKGLEQTAVEMGAVLGGEGLAALGALDDQMQIFSSTTSATKNILASAFAPAMSGALEGVNALGGAFNGLISAVISGDEGGIENAMTMISEQVTLMVENVTTILPELLTIAEKLISALLDVIAQNLPTILTEGAKLLSSLLSGISKNIGSIFPVILSVVQTVAQTILQNLPMILQMGIQVLVSLIQGISSMLPDLIPLCIDTVVLLAESLLDNIDLIIDAGISLIFALADGLIDALPRLLEKIPVIFSKLLSAISSNLPKLIEMGGKLVVQLVGGLVKSLPQMIKAGGELLAGLFKGLLDPTTIWNAVKSLFNGIIGGIKDLFGIHSPSKVFEDEVGKNLALGLGEGFENTMSDVTDEMASAIPTEFDTDINANLNSVSGKSSVPNYNMMVSAFKQALTEVKVVLDNREMGGFVTDVVERQVFA